MGPNEEHLKQVQRDAVNTTIRHFRDEIEDETFATDADLDKVKKDLLTSIDTSGNQTVDGKDVSKPIENTAAQPDSSGKSAGGAAPSREAVKDAKPTNKTSNSRQ